MMTWVRTRPIDNVVTEFLPDLAKHIKIRIVLIQRIVNYISHHGTKLEAGQFDLKLLRNGI